MSIDKYTPNAAPLNASTLPEYVLRELRRVGAVVNKGFETVEASLSALAVSLGVIEQYSVSAGMKWHSATGVVVFELDGGNLTRRSISVSELYLLAFDPSLSGAVRVNVLDLPSSGGGGGLDYRHNITIDDHETSAVWTTYGLTDEFEYGSLSYGFDTTGARFSGAKPWQAVPGYPGMQFVGIEDGHLHMASSLSGGSAQIMFAMDAGTLSFSFSVVGKLMKYGGWNNYSGLALGLIDGGAASIGAVGAAARVQGELKYTGGRKIEVPHYNAFSSLAISAVLDTVQYDLNWFWFKFKSDGTNYSFMWSYNGILWFTPFTRALLTDFPSLPRWISLHAFGSGLGTDTCHYFVDYVRFKR